MDEEYFFADAVADPTTVANLLDQIDSPFETLMGDGAYNRDTISQAVLAKQCVDYGAAVGSARSNCIVCDRGYGLGSRQNWP